MEELLIQTLHKIDIGNLIAIIGVSWFFYCRSGKRLDKIENQLHNLDKRLSCVEIVVSMKECAIRTQSQEKVV